MTEFYEIKKEAPINPALKAALSPLQKYYSDPNVVEIRVNMPGEMIIAHRQKGKYQIKDSNLNKQTLVFLGKSLANVNGLLFDPAHTPKLSCILPEGHRFEMLTGNSTPSGISMAIRCKHPFNLSWDAFGIDDQTKDYLIKAMKRADNLIISGATNTGKTTLANLLLNQIDAHERVLVMEDTPELDISRFYDGNRLLAAREKGTGNGLVDWSQLYDHSTRATPDRLLFGEISIQNANAALGVLNSGITGFLCTLHAESPHQAIHRKFSQNVAWSGHAMSDIPEYLGELVDLVVQIKRTTEGGNTVRHITDLYLPKQKQYLLQDRVWKGYAA